MAGTVEARVAYVWMAKGLRGGAKTIRQWRVDGAGPPLDDEALALLRAARDDIDRVLAAQESGQLRQAARVD